METPSGDKGRLGGKFEGFTHTPSDGLFERIAARADERPGALGGRFQAWEHAPNAAVWTRIEKRAHPWHGGRLGWASAALAGLLVLGGLGVWKLGAGEDVSKAQVPALTAARQMHIAEQDHACGDSAFLRAGNFFGMQDGLLSYPFGGSFMGGYNCGMQYPFMGCGGVIVSDPWQNELHNTSEPVQSLDSAQQVLEAKADSMIMQNPPQEEYFPEIELPKGNEAEGAFGFRLGTNLSQGAYANGTGPVFREDAAFNSSPLNMDNFAYTGGGDREDFSTPFVVGFTVDVPLSKRFHLLPGISYTVMKSHRGSDLEVEATRQYLGLGLSGSYDVFKGKRGSAYVLVGAQADAGISATQNEKTRNSVLDPVEVVAGQHLAVLAGLGVNRMVTKHIGFYAQAQANTYVLQTVPNLWSQKAVWPVAQVGVKVQL